MISRLQGHRVESASESANTGSFACASPDRKQLQVLVWNYGARIPEAG